MLFLISETLKLAFRENTFEKVFSLYICEDMWQGLWYGNGNSMEIGCVTIMAAVILAVI